MMEPPTNTDMSENENTTENPAKEEAKERLSSRDLLALLNADRARIATRWGRYSAERMDEPEALSLYAEMKAFDAVIEWYHNPRHAWANGQGDPHRESKE